MSGRADRDTFVQSRRARWDELEKLVAVSSPSPARWSRLASLYRGLCADLATAQSLGVARDVEAYLDDLAGRAHNQLYGVRQRGGVGLIGLVFAEFPRELRRSWPFFLAANLLFWGPFVLGAVGSLVDPGFALTVLPESQLSAMEEMYSNPALAREAGGDAMMAGFYVANNVGIALQCFTTGIFAGMGSMFFLVYNGLVLGVVEGYLWRVGYGWNLLTFTAGHSAWELMGVVVAGTAGLRLGWSLVVTEGRTRAGSLRHGAPVVYRLVVGATAMILVAAAIEGFWSASPVPAPLKWVFGLVQVFIVALWLLLGGRR